MPFFSVIVPIYKVEKYLEQCVESILNQSFSDFELILVDDGSPDRCPEICDNFAAGDERIKVIHKKNGGSSDARNAGMEIACGEYLTFVDSDDYLASSAVLQTLADAAATKPDLVDFGVVRYHENTGIYVMADQVPDHGYDGLDEAQTICRMVEKKDLSISACRHIYRRAFLEEHHFRFVVGIKCEDIDWSFRIMACMPKIVVLKEGLYVYRASRPGSITSTADYAHLQNYCKLLEDGVALLEQCDERIRPALLSYAMYHVLICLALCRKRKLPASQRRAIYTRLKTLSVPRIQQYTADSRVRLAAKVYGLVGFRMMAWAVGFYLTHRGAEKHSFTTENKTSL